MQGRVGRTRGLLLFAACCLFIFVSGRAEVRRHVQQTARPAPAVAAHLLKLPLSFVPNVGQVADDAHHRVDFVSAGRGYSLFLTSGQAVLALNRDAGRKAGKPAAARTAVLRMKLRNANPQARAAGVDKLPGKSNYFIGNNPSRWHTNVPTYAKVKYQDVYPGIDLTFYGNQRHLEFDFDIAPKADPGRIRLALQGATHLRVNSKGELIAEVDGGTVRFHKPLVYQPAADGGSPARHYVDGDYVLGRDGQVRFKVAAYDRAQPLVIDPMLSYSTFLGGTGVDNGSGIAVDSSGNAYVTGSTTSPDFPTKSAISSSLAGTTDAFVAKINPSGSALVYSTYLGGNQVDQGTAIAVDSSDDAYVVGSTGSSDFPTTSGSLQPKFAGGQTDGFVVKINPAGDTLTYATYLGGTGDDVANGIALDSSGDAYVVGSTTSTDFPTANPVQPANAGQSDAFLSKIKPDGSALIYSTYLGGSASDSAWGVAVDSSGQAYVAGSTLSSDFPTANPYQPAYGGGSTDAFVAKYNAAGSSLMYSTYLGGSGQDRAYSIAVDSSGNAFVTGDTTSTQFPTTSGALQTTNQGEADAFVTELDANGTVSYSSYLGGSLTDGGRGIAVDGSNNIFVTGFTQSADFPVQNALDATFGGGTCGQGACFDAFVTELNPASGIVYSTFLGGNGNDNGQAIALGASDTAYVTGATYSDNFPATAGALQDTAGSSGSSSDAFVAEISAANNPSVALYPQSLTFGSQATGTTSSAQTVTVTNFSTAALTVSSISVSGDFSQTNNCTSSSVAAGGGSCTISVKFSPTTTGSLTGTLTINDTAAGSSQTVDLTGTGATPAPAVSLSTTSLTFPDQTVGTTSASMPVTVTNSGSADLTFTGISISGSSSTSKVEFTETDNCTSSLAPGKSCTIDVVFAPEDTGSLTASVSVEDNAGDSPQTINLTGTGVAVFTLTSNQGSTTVDGATASTTFTITLNAPSSFSGSVGLACANNSSATCSFSSTSITAGQSSTLTVGNLTAVAPTTLDFQVQGTSSSTSGSTTLSQTASVSLQVLFKNFTVAVSPPLATVNAGQAATYTLTMTPYNGFSDSVTVSCSNLPAKASCSTSPASPTVSGSTPITVTLKVSTTSNSMMGPGSGPIGPAPGSGPWLWILSALALVFLIILASRRVVRPRRLWAGIALLVVLVCGAAACNSTYINPIKQVNTASGTPPGVYAVVITAKSKSYTRTISTNLAVN